MATSSKIKKEIKSSSAPAQILVILGPTASGKTAFAIHLARQFAGEIISADSRQVYRGLDVGSGKDLIQYSQGGPKVRYHLIDVVSPQVKFDLAQYQKLAFQAIKDILARHKLPIIVGGSGLYLQAVVDHYNLSTIKPNLIQRAQNEDLSAEELLSKITKLKPEFAQHLNNSERHNIRHLVRYLEIVEAGIIPGKTRKKSPYDFLIFGLSWSDKILRERILQRILERLEKEGMVAEVQALHEQGLSWQRLKSFGLEYKFISQHLLEELSYSEMIDKLAQATYRFAKRQKTWFKRWEKQGKKIEWVKSYQEVLEKMKK